MKLLQTLLFVLAGLLAATPAWADANDPQVQALKKRLNLTEKQTEELDKIFKEINSKTAALRKEIASLNKEKHDRMNAVLTAEQKKKLEVEDSDPFQGLGGELPPSLEESPPRR